MPRWATSERAILEVLARKGEDALGPALMAVPRTMRMMYLHAYQSYLWNLAASHRCGGWEFPLLSQNLDPSVAFPAILTEYGHLASKGSWQATSFSFTARGVALLHRVRVIFNLLPHRRGLLIQRSKPQPPVSGSMQCIWLRQRRLLNLLGSGALQTWCCRCRAAASSTRSIRPSMCMQRLQRGTA